MANKNNKINYSKYYWQNKLVRLRAMKPEDWEGMFHNYYDSEARRMLEYKLELPPTHEAGKEVTEKFSNFDPECGRLMFVIENLKGDMVGSLNISGIDERNGTFGIGIQVDIDKRGKGYGTAAMKLLINYAFNERRLHKFNVSVLEGNIASATMMKKLGCKKEGVRREVIFTDGEYKDEILYGLIRGEFNIRFNQKK
ncbi:MAG: GNAT family N-acetyltransferase [Fusobacteriota bacterium]